MLAGELLAIRGASWQNLKMWNFMTKPLSALFLMLFLSASAPAYAGTDLNQAENQALESAQWFKTHFPEAMTPSPEGSRLMQHSVEEIPAVDVPVEEKQ